MSVNGWEMILGAKRLKAGFVIIDKHWRVDLVTSSFLLLVVMRLFPVAMPLLLQKIASELELATVTQVPEEMRGMIKAASLREVEKANSMESFDTKPVIRVSDLGSQQSQLAMLHMQGSPQELCASRLSFFQTRMPGIRHLLLLPGWQQLWDFADLWSSRRGQPNADSDIVVHTDVNLCAYSYYHDCWFKTFKTSIGTLDDAYTRPRSKRAILHDFVSTRTKQESGLHCYLTCFSVLTFQGRAYAEELLMDIIMKGAK